MNSIHHRRADDRAEAKNGIIKLHGPEGFEGMRRAGRLAAEILDALASPRGPWSLDQELDDIVHKMTLDAGAVPATLGYRGYTKSCCISINHVVCHGIPSDRTIRRTATSSTSTSRRSSTAGTATPAACTWSATCP